LQQWRYLFNPSTTNYKLQTKNSVRSIAAPLKEVEIVSIKIIIAAHKKYWMPTDPVYILVHVGAEGMC
jgi:hypothetical protein